MPTYIFQNPKTGEVKEVVQGINEKHTYKSEGISWNRVYTSPTISIDSRIDPFSESDFVKKTAQGKQSVGDLWDRSQEMSEKRKQKDGVDIIAQKAEQKNSGKRVIKKPQTDFTVG